jgi:predicted DCC family thiol-disulfide oxidoreductase YuxK
VLPNIDPQQPVLFFDGVCNLCNSSVQTIIRLDKKQYFKFASLQSKLGEQLIQHIADQTLDSVILLFQNKYYTESSAILKIASILGFPYSLAMIAYVIPAFLRNMMYRFIAKNRYKWFGKKEACMLPDPALKSRFLE